MISFSILFSILWKPTSVGTPTEAVLKVMLLWLLLMGLMLFRVLLFKMLL